MTLGRPWYCGPRVLTLWGPVGEKRILIVDDEVGIVEVLSAILVDEGYLVDAAPNGREALASIARHRPQLVVLDTMMPVMDGLAALRAIRVDPALADVRVIMMTAMANFPQHLDGPAPDAFLHKPFDLDDLLGRIVALVGPARAVEHHGEL
jgi:two-component system, OmpR family, phosphate regulon response regulator PhoB